MAHDFLDRFQVGLILAETGAEGVPQVMSGKMGDFNRGSAFFLRVFQFFKVAVFPHSLQHAVDAAWIKQVSIPVQKDKVGVTVYDRLPQRTALRLLSGMFFQKRGTDFLQHGNRAIPGFAFGCADLHGAGAASKLSIYHAVIDRDQVLFKIAVFPPEPDQLPDPAASSEKYC